MRKASLMHELQQGAGRKERRYVETRGVLGFLGRLLDLRESFMTFLTILYLHGAGVSMAYA